MLPAIYDFWYQAFEAEKASGQQGWAYTFRFLNLFQYITFRAASAGLLSFILSVIFGPRVIRRLISLKVGQPIRTAEEVHKLAELHGGKIGTPTMGGVLIIGSVLISTLGLRPSAQSVHRRLRLHHGGLRVAGILRRLQEGEGEEVRRDQQPEETRLAVGDRPGRGVFPLFQKGNLRLRRDAPTDRRRSRRLSAREDIRSTSARFVSRCSRSAIINLHWLIIPFFALVIVGCSNAVNLTDGLDGLATGTTISVALSYAFLAYLAGHFYMATEYLVIPHNRYIGELAIFLMALVGACFGFLWFNCHPAKVFMGDTGSLAIGGALGTAAICTKQELLLVIIGGVFVMEAMSVILQVGSFKLRKKRIFKMSPIHHHFELLGWHENQVIIRFWIISIMLALFGLALLKIA